MPRASGVPNSGDRRAWLRSYHYYRALLFERPAGSEALALCRPALEAAGVAVPALLVSGPIDDRTRRRSPQKAVETEASLARIGTPAGIHDGLPLFKEDSVWAEPWRLPVSAERMLSKLTHEVLNSAEDAPLMFPDPEDWRPFATIIRDRPYAIGSLRGFDILDGLRAGGILGELDRIGRRAIVWQIGPSAVAARALKLRYPRMTLAIGGDLGALPSTAAFLHEAFPAARIRVAGAGIEPDWEADDFVLATHEVAASLQPPALDLALDVLALQAMPQADASALVARAHDLGALYFASLALEGTSPEWPLRDILPELSARYWMHALPLEPRIDWQVAALMDEGYAARGWIRRPDEVKHWKMNQTFRIGWRRLSG